MSQLVENPIRVSIKSQQPAPVPGPSLLSPSSSQNQLNGTQTVETTIIMDKTESGDARIDPCKYLNYTKNNYIEIVLICINTV